MTTIVNKRKLLETIEKFCVSCAPDNDVTACNDKNCPLWSHRLGEVENGGITGLLKSIRFRCAECMTNSRVSYDTVKVCQSTNCGLWPWRMGKKDPQVFDKNDKKTSDILFGSGENDDDTGSVLFD